jgi:long-subunit acyl-CoA synthetase (AMP-forming)
MCFSFLLDRLDGPPSIDLLRCYLKMWRILPEAAKSSSDPGGVAFVNALQQQVQESVGTLLSLFPIQQALALTDSHGGKAITHHRLYTFIQNFNLPMDVIYTKPRKPVVILALPNGYLLGLASLAVATYYTAMPINISSGAEQFSRDAMLTTVKSIMVLESDMVKLGLREPWVAAAGIDVLVVEEDLNSTFSVRRVGQPINRSGLRRLEPNSGEDFALILLTSGTSGKKKVVPISVFSLIIGTCCVIDSWGLGGEDTCINMMPLNHV